MPTLMQKIQQGSIRRDSTGQLTRETPEELQSLSGKMGLQAAPMTPLGAQVVGANPDQAKMAGTPAQKNAALAASVQPGQSLQDTLRRNQGNQSQQGNATQQASIQKSDELKNLGGIGDRVQGFIEAQRQKLAAATQAAQSPEVQAAQTFNGKDISQIKPLLAQLRANPGDQQLMLQVNQALGYNTSTQLDPSQVNQLYESSVDAIARAGAGNVDSDLTVDDLVGMSDFGYDKAELSHLLGVPEDQVSGMNVAQIRDRVAQIQAEEYSNTQKLEEQANSGQVGAAERALAREGAREASRMGTRSSEADVAHLEQQIAAGDQVQFGGKQYSVEDLLADDTISGIIGDYLNTAPGSPERAQLEQTEPALAQFIQKNQTLLNEASKNLQAGASQFQDTQKFNQGLVAQLPANLAKLVVPEAASLSASKIDVNSKPLLQYIQSNPAMAQQIQGIDDHDAQALSSLNSQQLNQLFQNGGQGWKQYQQDRVATRSLQQRADQVSNPQQALDLVFNGRYAGDPGQLQANMQKSHQASLLGLPANDSDYADLDSDHDGKVDPPDQLLQAFRNRVGDYSLQDALQGKRPSDGALKAPEDASSSWHPDQRKVFDGLSAEVADGHIDANELANSKLTVADILGIPTINPQGPAFGSAPEFAEGVARKAQSEISSKYKGDSLQDLLAASQELDKVRNQLKDKLQNTGNSDQAFKAFEGFASELNKKIDQKKQQGNQQNQAALKKSQDDWDKKYQGVYKDQYGHWVKKVGDQLVSVPAVMTSIPARPK